MEMSANFVVLLCGKNILTVLESSARPQRNK